MNDQVVTLDELTSQGDDIKVVEEGRYRLTPSEEFRHT